MPEFTIVIFRIMSRVEVTVFRGMKAWMFWVCSRVYLYQHSVHVSKFAIANDSMFLITSEHIKLFKGEGTKLTYDEEHDQKEVLSHFQFWKQNLQEFHFCFLFLSRRTRAMKSTVGGKKAKFPQGFWGTGLESRMRTCRWFIPPLFFKFKTVWNHTGGGTKKKSWRKTYIAYYSPR